MVMMIPLLFWLAIPGMPVVPGGLFAPQAVVSSPALPGGARAGGRWPGVLPSARDDGSGKSLRTVGLRF